MSVIFIDTNCELLLEKAREQKVSNLIRMPYTICGTEYYYDLGEKFNPVEYFNMIRQGNMPITSGLNSEDYKEYFEPFFAKNEDILYISFSSKLSGTFAYMDTAVKELSEKYPKARFRRFDTKGISLAAGIPVYEALKLHNAGKSNDEIIAFLEEFTPRVNAVVSPNDLFHLKRGGRISTASAALGTLLQLKPILRLNKEGALYSATKVNGRNKALNYIADDVIANADTAYPIALIDADSTSDVEKVYAKVKVALPNAEIWRNFVGPVIGTHCGPDTVAALYVSKTPIRE